LETLLALGEPSPEDGERLRGAEAAATKESELLQTDLEMLREFASNLSVTVLDEAGRPKKISAK
jgi:hypothetical protein